MVYLIFLLLITILAQQACNITRTCPCKTYCSCEGQCLPYSEEVQSQIGYFKTKDNLFIDYDFDKLQIFLQANSTSVDAFNGYFTDSHLVQAACDFWQVNTTLNKLVLTTKKSKATKFLLQNHQNSTNFCVIDKTGRRAYTNSELKEIHMFYPQQVNNTLNLLVLKAVKHN